MLVENTINNRKVADAVQNLALENMYVSKDVIEGSLDVCNEKRQWDDWFKEVLKKYE